MENRILPASLALSLLSTPALAQVSPEVAAYLNPSRQYEIGLVFEAFLSPHQEGGEEEDAPPGTPSQFLSTAPSRDRDERAGEAGHRGHALLRFTRDLSKAYVDVVLEANYVVDADEVVMFHIHCGRPGILGPIIIDFALMTDIYENFADDGVFSVELTNADIEENNALGDEDLTAAFSRGCIIPSPTLEQTLVPVKTNTIAGLARIAEEGDLYFNLHTAGQTFYGDMRGQVYPVAPAYKSATIDE